MIFEESAIWEYQLTANTVPSDPSTEPVPSSGWISDATSPFGDGTLPDNLLEPQTEWTATNGLWIRRFVNTTGLKEIVFKVKVLQSFFMYWGGQYYGFYNVSNTNKSSYQEVEVVIQVEDSAASNYELAFLCLHNNASSETYFSVEADYIKSVVFQRAEAPLKEKITWFTDVFISKNASEERVTLTDNPIRNMEVKFPASEINKRALRNLFWAEAGNQVLLPNFTQAVYLGSVAADQDSITADLSYVTSCSKFILMNESSYQVLGVDTFGSSSITFTSLTQGMERAFLLPLNNAKVESDLERAYDGYNSNYNIEFRILDRDNIDSYSGDTYNSADVYTEPPTSTLTEQRETFRFSVDEFDAGFGHVDFYNNWSNNRSFRQHSVYLSGKQELWEFKEWLYRRKGRYLEFYWPTFENDLKLNSTGTLTDVINVDKDNYLKYDNKQTILAFKTNSGWIFRTIVGSASVDENTMNLTLSSALGIASDEVSYVSWGSKRRLDTDIVELRHLKGGITTANLYVVEIE